MEMDYSSYILDWIDVNAGMLDDLKNLPDMYKLLHDDLVQDSRYGWTDYATFKREFSFFLYNELGLDLFDPKYNLEEDSLNRLFENIPLKSFKIPNGCKTIPYHCFKDSGLEQIDLPDTIELIDSGAFAGCNFKTFTCPENLIALNSGAFGICPYLTEVTLNDKLTDANIDSGLFSGCANLTKVNFPKTLKSIPYGMFRYAAFKKFVIPDQITVLRESAFEECSELEEITLSKNLVTIGLTAFRDCPKLKSITIPSSCKIIGVRAFRRCYGLTEINFNPGLVEIGNAAFAECKNLSKMTLPDGLIRIEKDAFKNCPKLGVIEIPQSVREFSALGKVMFRIRGLTKEQAIEHVKNNMKGTNKAKQEIINHLA